VAQRLPDTAHWAAYFDLVPNCFEELARWVPLGQEDNLLKLKNSADTPGDSCMDRLLTYRFRNQLPPLPQLPRSSMDIFS
jgi:hypothetical protein